MLWIVRVLLSVPLITAFVFTIERWSFFETETSQLWAVYIVCIIGVVTVFLIFRVRLPESFSSYQHAEHYVRDTREHRDVFTVPVVCPVCMTPLKLNEVKWQDQNTLLCQECHSEVDVTIV